VGGLWRRLTGRGLPDGFTGELAADEHVIAHGGVRGGGHLVATSLGLWLPEGRRVGWHLISKATWGGNALVVVEAEESGTAGAAVLLTDLPPKRFVLDIPMRLPETVHARVTGSIRTRHRHELPGGGVWFLQRKVPGQDGVVLQVRPDEGVDADLIQGIAADVAAKLRAARDVQQG
jgi:hypothetical protein